MSRIEPAQGITNGNEVGRACVTCRTRQANKALHVGEGTEAWYYNVPFMHVH